MMKRVNSFLHCIIILLCLSCAAHKKPYISDKASSWKAERAEPLGAQIYDLWLIGDTGEIDDKEKKNNYTVDAMVSAMDLADGQSAVVYLGDNIYPYGMPEEDDPDRAFSEAIIDAQLAPLNDYSGEIYMIPGNHDWNKHKRGGRKAILRQEEYVEDFNNHAENIHFYPSDACGDPKVVKVNKDLVFVFVDSQWWLHDWSLEKKMNKGCDIKSRIDFLVRIEEIFAEYKNDQIVFMQHHPFYANGHHGGQFSLADHIFPTHDLGVWFPLPVIGSLYPIYRNATGSKQDIPHVLNQELLTGIQQAAAKYRCNVIYASGHEHGLMYYERGREHYLTSGAGGKTSYIAKGNGADYARQQRGFMRVQFYENNEVWLSIYTVEGPGEDAVLALRSQLRAPRAGTQEEEIVYPPLTAHDTILPANAKFAAGGMKKALLGAQYRDMWATPVTAQIIDLEHELGGLTPIKKGGGMASNSLRMEVEDGRHYILRSINKDYRKLVPEDFGNLRLLDLLKDQNSASHPYGALIIPKLSQAAQIYYTSPRLVYLQHQRGLGNYNSQFPEELYLLEQRPSGSWKGYKPFGGSEDIISFLDLLEKLRTKRKHFIDQEWVLRSRLFDLWIHDWDRHDDQWRWASFDTDEGTLYRPIPRDRDQAFYKFKGFFPSIIAAFYQKKFKTMKGDVKDVESLAFNAKHFDRYFLNSLNWEEWEQTAIFLQEQLTDDVIDAALKDLPDEVEHTDNVELRKLLISRRKNLVKISRRLYEFLSKEVEIVGTDLDDRFEITFLAEGQMNVAHYVTKKGKKDVLRFERTFNADETDEVRIYGQREEDVFEIKGSDKAQITLRIIGGEQDDIVINASTQKNIHVYDKIDGISVDGDYKNHTSDDLYINEYDRNEFQYNTSFPTLILGRTLDDGWWFGAGLSWINRGWRKSPYKSQHNISGSFAPGSQNAIQFNYSSHYPGAFGTGDFRMNTEVNFPRYENFFGLGNNSPNDMPDDIQFNWVRLESVEIAPSVDFKVLGSDRFTIGPLGQYQHVVNREGRIGDQVFSEDVFDSRYYVGGRAHYRLGFTDIGHNPSNGFQLQLQYDFLNEIDRSEQVHQFSADMAFYVMLTARPRLVLAQGLGYRKAGGELQFHQFADLGNRQNLRGYRNNRFRGESAFYHNTDLRLSLFKWQNTWIPMDVGLVGGFDQGRVWLDGEDSEQWHRSVTVGLWMDVFGAAVLQPSYSFTDTDEPNTFSLFLGFAF